MAKEKETMIPDEERSFNGYLPSPPDARDYTYDRICMLAVEQELPEEYITDRKVPILNQGCNSDCVAHAIATATAHGQYKAEHKFNDLSRGYIYGNRRVLDHQGEGMFIRQALKNFNHDGDCLTSKFPYTGSYPVMKEKIAEKAEEYAEAAAKLKLVNYCRLYSETEIKKAIMNQGAVVVGITTYKDSFGEHIKIPTKDSVPSGGHAMCCIGWNKEGWIIQNSWGSWWGDHGLCYMPYEYPVDEWWGLTASPSLPDPERDNFLKRIGGWFKMISTNLVTGFRIIKNWLINLFKKKK